MAVLDQILDPRDDATLAPITIDKAVFLGLWIESVLYGIFLVLFVGTIYALVYKRSTDGVNRIMLATACSFLVLSTTHIIINLVRCLNGFINNSGNTILYLSNIADPLHVAQTAVYGTQALIADSLLVYRIYVVWRRNVWSIILPILMIIAEAVAGYGAVYKLNFVGQGGNVFVSELTAWVTSFFCITLCTNILCTLMLAFRIWSSQKGFVGGYGQRKLSDVIQIVVESGAIYSAALILQIIFYLIKSNAQYTVLDPFAPLIGIVFCMIIIRVALGLTSGGSTRGKTSTQQSHSLSTFHASSQHRGQTSLTPNKAVAVNVKQAVHQYTDPSVIDVGHEIKGDNESYEDERYGGAKPNNAY